MPQWLLLLAVVVSLLSSIAQAEPPPRLNACGDRLPGNAAVGIFAPPVPSASEAITITVGVSGFSADAATAIQQGNSINVTLVGSNITFEALPPPTVCTTASFGPLPAGTYAVSLFLVVNASPPTTPALVATTMLVVAPASSYVPTTSNAILATLAALLAFGGFLSLRVRAT